MDTSKLPAEWEALSHSARVQKAIEVGRQSRTDTNAEKLLRDWRYGGFTQRLLATFACYGSRDSASLLALTANESRTIARVAISVLCHVGDDESLLIALGNLPPRSAAKVLFRLRRRRLAVVDRFIRGRVEAGDTAAWPLVPLGSPAVLDSHFVFAAERGGDIFWRRLTVLHPARAAAEVVARLDAATNPDGLLFAYARTAITILSDRDSDLALVIVASLRRHVPLTTIPFVTLVVRRPVAVADLLLNADEAMTASFERVAPKLGVARIVSLFRRGSYYLGTPDWWLGRLPAADRVTVYRELEPAWTAADGVVPLSILRCLPSTTLMSLHETWWPCRCWRPVRSSGCRLWGSCLGMRPQQKQNRGWDIRRRRTVPRLWLHCAKQYGSTALNSRICSNYCLPGSTNRTRYGWCSSLHSRRSRRATDADAPAFAAAFTRLLDHRRELASSVVAFAAATRILGSRLVEVRTAVLAAVEADPSVVTLQVQLAAARYAAEPFARWALKLVGTPCWHAATQNSAFDALVATAQPVEELERGEATLAASEDAAARWIALRVLAWVASVQGWNDERRKRLSRYRVDPSPLVADQAGLIFPPELFPG